MEERRKEGSEREGKGGEWGKRVKQDLEEQRKEGTRGKE